MLDFPLLCDGVQTARAIGSGVEHILHTDGVAGSNPASPTTRQEGQAQRRLALFEGTHAVACCAQCCPAVVVDHTWERAMADSTNPVEAFGLHIAHIGINAGSFEEAREVAGLFETLMGLKPHETPVSVFADTLIEVMSGHGRGTHGHMGFGVHDIVQAEAWFVGRGFEIDESSRALNPDGSTRLIYFRREIAGFAIHLVRD